MRVAILGKKYPFCGIVTYCRELVSGLRAAGHAVAFLHVHDQPDADAPEEWLPALWRTPLFAVPTPGTRTRLKARLAAFEPEIVHASFALGPLDWALPAVCRELDVPLVATVHVALDHRPSLPGRVADWVYRAYGPTLRACDRVIVMSERQAGRVRALGVDPERIAILPHGVDVDRYHPGPSTFKAGLGDRLLATFLGRIDAEKNVGLLLQAWQQLAPPHRGHLAIAGDGYLRRPLEARYRHLPHTQWLGFIAEEAARIDLLRGTDLFVLPSSVEGLSLALLEAMACGAVPLVTDVGADGEVAAGVGEVLDPSGLGQTLEPAMAQLLAQPEELARLGRLARRRIEERYSQVTNMARLQGLYREVRAVAN